MFAGKKAKLYTKKATISHNQMKSMKNSKKNVNSIPMVSVTKFKTQEDIKVKQDESTNATPSVTKTTECHTQEIPTIPPNMKKTESTNLTPLTMKGLHLLTHLVSP